MYRPQRGRILIIVCVLAIVACDVSVSVSQPIWLSREGDRVITWEFLKPNFAGDDHTSFLTSANFLSCRVRVQKIAVVAEIPFAHYGLDVEDSDEGDDAIGNPYIGVELSSGENFFVELGARLPLAPDDNAAVLLGVLTDYVDRAEAFAVDAIPIVGAVNYLYRNPSGLGFRLRGGPSVLMATGDRNEAEAFILYSAQVGYFGPVVNFSGGLSGRWWLTSELDSFGEETLHQFVFALGFTPGVVQPSVNIRLPLDEDLSDMFDWVLGVNLAFNLP